MLGIIIQSAAERERIATEIGVHPITLMRWVTGESSPRPHNLRQLLRALPKVQRSQFSVLLEDAFPESVKSERKSAMQELSFPFVMSVLDAYADIPDPLRAWSIMRLVLPEAVRQLDPEQLGILITVVRCMPPREGKIHSLRESAGLGTFPWSCDLEEKALLLGAESLAGHVVTSCRIEQISDLRKNTTFLPAYVAEHEVSAAACPIMRASRVAGCLLFASTQPDYFSNEASLTLIRGYAQLIALAFNAEEFYEPALLSLQIMPPLAVQQEYLQSFRPRVLRLLHEAVRDEANLTGADAELRAWQEIEALLLNRSSS